MLYSVGQKCRKETQHPLVGWAWGARLMNFSKLQTEVIKPSKSEWGSPCILVRKPLENGIQQPPRFVVDYRGLNSVTKGDDYPIPSIASILDSISVGKVFGHCDLASGYWQILLRSQDFHKSALYDHIFLEFGFPCCTSK